ncbi:MAG TPA: rhodanese-like domain-containing protein [Acetobacteraceae bacterium]|nr:rhodanese-like domain-containing protein [Acetobacteraceae bacterium]
MFGLSRRLRRSRPAAPAWIEAETLSRRLSGDTPPLILDVRTGEEFVGPLGHIAGAVNIPMTELPTRVPELARQMGTIVTVCKTDRRSAAAAAQLCAAGAVDVAVLRGGMERWHALGL